VIRPFGFNDVIFLIESTRWTLWLTLIAFVGAAGMGMIVAVVSLFRSRIIRSLMATYVVVFQGTPLLLQLFIIFFIPNTFGVTISALTAASIGLTLNGGAFLGEIWRGGLISVPRGQWEASRALGLFVIAPQAARITEPATVGFLVQFLKATSLASIIGFTELTRAGQIVVNSTFQPFQAFALIGLIYFCLCFPLSYISRRMERRPSR
jgi:polar amino acid transport system permease protein